MLYSANSKLFPCFNEPANGRAGGKSKSFAILMACAFGVVSGVQVQAGNDLQKFVNAISDNKHFKAEIKKIFDRHGIQCDLVQWLKGHDVQSVDAFKTTNDKDVVALRKKLISVIGDRRKAGEDISNLHELLV